jgi:hypothetical protein
LHESSAPRQILRVGGPGKQWQQRAAKVRRHLLEREARLQVALGEQRGAYRAASDSSFFIGSAFRSV